MIRKNLRSIAIGIIVSMITPIISYAEPVDVSLSEEDSSVVELNEIVGGDSEVVSSNESEETDTTISDTPTDATTSTDTTTDTTTEYNFGFIPEDTSAYNFNTPIRFLLRTSSTESYFISGSNSGTRDLPVLPSGLLPGDQKKASICYIFATNKAMEYNIYKKTGNFVNISEKNPAYYFWNQAGRGSEGNALIDCYSELRDRGTSTINASRKAYSMGGNTTMLAEFYGAWKGITEDTGDDAFNNAISTNDKLYGATESMSVPTRENVYSSSIGHMKNTIMIPANSEKSKIKDLIKTYGAVTIGLNGYAYSSTNNYPAWYNTSTGCNHMVTIIGWDDDYDKTRFPNGGPTHNGAWYCMNSWGTAANTGIIDSNGCFWLSYEDGCFSSTSNVIAAYDMAIAGNSDMYDHNYIGGFAGGMAGHLEYISNVPEPAKFAISYTIGGLSTGKEKVRAIGFMNTDAAQKYSVKVYKGTGPYNKRLKESKTVYPGHAGFVTTELNTPFILNSGECVYVEMTPLMNSQGGVPFVEINSEPICDYLGSITAGSYIGAYDSYTYYARTAFGRTYLDDGLQSDKQALIHVYTSDTNESAPNEPENNPNDDEDDDNGGSTSPSKSSEEKKAEDENIKTITSSSGEYAVTLSMNKSVPFTKSKKEVISHLNVRVIIKDKNNNNCSIVVKKVTATKPKRGISKVTIKLKGGTKEEKRAVKQLNKSFKKIPITVLAENYSESDKGGKT